MINRVFDFASGRDERSGECPFLDWEQDFVEEVIDGFGVADKEHMSAPGDYMGWRGQTHGEDFVAGAVDMVKGLGDDRVFPFEDGVQGPADKAVVAGSDHLSHQAAAGCGAHPDGVFDDRG